MDSSSPMAVANASRDDDDGSLSVTSSLAKESELLFQSGKFSDCIRVLHQLLLKKENDPRVLHNILLAENFQDGCSDPKRLIKELNSVKKRIEELARAATVHTELTTSDGTRAVTGIEENSSAPHQHSALHSSIVFSEEFDISVTMYNLAVCWFHLHEYAKSFSILEACFQNIEPIDEKTAKRICLLLLDVALLSQNVARSAEVISYMEKVFCSNNLFSRVEIGNSSEQPPSTTVGPISHEPNNPDSPAAGIISEASLSRTLSDDGLEDDALHLISSMEIGGPHLQRKLGQQSSSDELSIADMRIKLHLCKVRFLLLAGNLKAAKREVKMAMNTAQGKDYSMALYLKSQLEYARGNHRKAIKLLMASSNRTETGISSIYYNNLGCIYYRLGNHHTSALFFTKALRSSSEKKPSSLSNISRDKSLLITYNCGVQYLRCGKPLQGAHCFYKAGLLFHNQPLLWLRMAECCLMALEKGLLSRGPAASDGCYVRVHVVGQGKWRQLVLQNVPDVLEDLVIHEGKLSISVLFARQCLVNALHLLHHSEENETKEEVKEQRVGTNSQNATLLSFVSEYEDRSRKKNLMIKQAVLADLAFVQLEMQDPGKALTTARSLLQLPECSRIYFFLGNIYAAEALCMMNRLNEALEHLSMYISGDLPYSQEDSEIWRLEKMPNSEDTNNSGSSTTSTEDSQQFPRPEEARGILFSNLAAMSAVQGDVEQAKRFLAQAVSVIPQRLEVTLTAIYIDLLCGKTQEALTKLKCCGGVRFAPESSSLDGSCLTW